MASSKEIISYDSLSNINTQNLQPNNNWASQGRKNNIYPTINSYNYNSSSEEQEESEQETEPNWAQQRDNSVKSQPEVNLRNVLLGLIAIVTGQTKNSPKTPQKSENSSFSFLGSNTNGDSFLLPSVYLPSAPPLLTDSHQQTNHSIYNSSIYKSVLESEPPDWLPDSCTSICMQCNSQFTPLTKTRHHCRFCGGVFCNSCTKGRSLLPVKFRERNPKRVCDACYEKLDPVQGLLVNLVSNASQGAKHDVMDWTCKRGWLNLPVGLKMEDEIYKAANTLRNYTQVSRLNPEKSIPHAVLNAASGLAVITVMKVGAVLTYKLGTGLVVARKPDGSWSAPSSILSAGLGWGAQIGGELTDFILVLHGSESVKTFTSQMHFSLGAGLSAAAGPVGRVLEADVRAGEKGSGCCYTYSLSKGAFVGVSLEGNVVVTRMDANLLFYGDPYLTTTDILLGTVERPRAASPLYTALNDLYSKLRYL
ncbi:hypothetical protein LUZ60_017567 [Juncus effusus]|nr:hypothetical protein LUZ60_017567 [Juncus effusus]